MTMAIKMRRTFSWLIIWWWWWWWQCNNVDAADYWKECICGSATQWVFWKEHTRAGNSIRWHFAEEKIMERLRNGFFFNFVIINISLFDRNPFHSSIFWKSMVGGWCENNMMWPFESATCEKKQGSSWTSWFPCWVGPEDLILRLHRGLRTWEFLFPAAWARS